MGTKIKAALPKQEGRNGMSELFRQLLEAPGRPRFAVVQLETAAIEDRLDNGDKIFKLAIEWIEPALTDVDEEQLAQLLHDMKDRRWKRDPIPGVDERPAPAGDAEVFNLRTASGVRTGGDR
jgi:hypothetical protein